MFPIVERKGCQLQKGPEKKYKMQDAFLIGFLDQLFHQQRIHLGFEGWTHLLILIPFGISKKISIPLRGTSFGTSIQFPFSHSFPHLIHKTFSIHRKQP